MVDLLGCLIKWMCCVDSRDGPEPSAAAHGCVGSFPAEQVRTPEPRAPWRGSPGVGMAGRELPEQECCHTLGEGAPPDRPPAGGGVWVQWD